MTTIACDGKTIAWDSLYLVGDMIVPLEEDKVVFRKGRIYGTAGTTPDCDKAVLWHMNGARESKAPGGEWEMLVISNRGMRIYSPSIPKGYPLAAPFAIGSGTEYALGALFMEASAAQAVGAAVRWNVATGGPVKSITIKDGLALARKRHGQKVRSRWGRRSSHRSHTR